jgi:transcriptional regulator with XRE-family HTH domain
MPHNDMDAPTPRRKTVDRFAEAVRVARARRQWSQAEVAQRAGTTPDRVSRVENAAEDLRLSTAEKIADALGLSFAITEAAA